MPRVPVYERREQTSPMPRPNVSAAPDTDALGEPVGQGIGKLVAAAGSVMTTAVKAHEDEVEKVNKARDFEAYSRIGEWKRLNLYDRDNGYLSKQGEDALKNPKTDRPLSDELLSSFDKFTADIEKGASNEAQRDSLRRLTFQEREGVFKELMGHERRQFEVTNNQKYEAGQETAISNAANGYLDPTTGMLDNNALSTARTIGEGAVVARAKQMGWSGDQTASEMRKFRTRFHMAVLDRMTDNEQGPLAAAYLRDNANEIDGKARGDTNIDKVVAAASLKQRSMAEADRLQAIAPDDLGTQVKEALKLPDPNLQEEVVKHISQRYSLAEKARDDTEKQILGRVFQRIIDSGGYVDRTNKDFQMLRDEAKARALDKGDSMIRQTKASDAEARRVQQEYDRRALAYFESLDDKTKASSTFSAQDNKVFDGISDVAKFQLEARKNRAVKDIEQGQIPKKQEFDDIVAGATRGLSKASADKVRNFMTDWRIRWYDNNEQKPPTRDDIKKIGLVEAVESQIVPGFLFDSEKKAYELTPQERKTAHPKNPPAAPVAPELPRVAPSKTLEDDGPVMMMFPGKSKPTPVHPLRVEEAKKKGARRL